MASFDISKELFYNTKNRTNRKGYEMKIRNLFKKKQIEPVAAEPAPETVEDKGVSYTEFLRAIGERLKIAAVNPDEKFKELFPRTICDIKPMVQTKGGKLVAQDSDITFSRTFDNQIPPAMLGFLNQTFIGYQACALLKQNAFIDKACTIPAKDAIAPDYKLSYINDADKKADEETTDIDELADIKDQSRRIFKINDICVKQTMNKKAYGYSLVIPMVDGVDMEKPYNIDGVKKGSYHGMAVVEPFWVSPQLDTESAGDPSSPHFYEPTWYILAGGKKIHRSWVIRAVNSEVSDVLKPTYYFGGVPLTQQIYERVYAADKVANEAPMLALTKRLLVVDADIENWVANPDNAIEVMEALTQLRDNYGVYAKRAGDQVSQIDTALADFDALIMTQYQLVASIAGMPATKLLKTTPKGFNATGEFEDKDYKQALVEIQENDYIPIITRHNELYTKSVYGRVIPLDVKFNPIDTPTEKEVAEIAQIKSQTAANHINAGITTADEERDILRNEDGSAYSALPEEIQEPDIDLNFDEEDKENGNEKANPEK